FFQAEDGIRVRNVTGVQTCALPILLRTRPATLRGHVRGYGLITAGLRRVPPDLPRDHRRTSAQVTSDSPHAPPCLRRGGNLRPLTKRQPRPRHQHPHPSIPPPTGSVATTL